MLLKKLLVNLALFDGEGGGSAASASGSGAGDASATGDTHSAVPESTRRGKKSGEFAKVKFGKQDAASNTTDAKAAENAAEGSAAGSQDAKASATLEERKKAFEDLINGEYKDLYTEKTQDMIDKRFKRTKQLEADSAAAQPIMDMLMQRYSIEDGDMSKLKAALDNDDLYWNVAAEEAGMSVDTFKEMQRLKRENKAHSNMQAAAEAEQKTRERVQGWLSEAEALKGKFPEFSLEKESGDPQFMAMLRRGVPLEHAYKIKYFDKLMSDATQSAAATAEKRVVDNVRAKGTRPAENGASSQSAFTVMDDPSKWNKKHRAEVARRVMRGEKIVL